MKKTQPLVSIIIPVREINEHVHEAMPQILDLNYSKFEVFIFTDHEENNHSWPKTRIIASGEVGPAEKRDLAIEFARGDILAFIDDDAFPHKDWLSHAVPHFDKEGIVAVGGPGVTPPTAGFLEQASGWVSASPFGSGSYSYRFVPGKRKFVDDYPSMNLLVRKSAFSIVGGFDSHYYPGEDTKLCLDLINLGRKIIYEPKAIVYHHRRPLWLPHLKQNGGYGLHRGYFAKILPKTSAKLIYFMPTLLVVASASFLISYFLGATVTNLFAVPISLYVILLTFNAIWVGISSNNLALALISIPAILLTHLWYGLRFMQGYLFTQQLKQ